MNPPTISPGPADHLSAIARLIRRLCLLREQPGKLDAILSAEQEFALAVRDHRLSHGVEALPESELQALFAEEKNRVADAVILAELLGSMLPVSPGTPVAGSTPGRPAYPTRERPPARPRPAAAAGGSPAIPDLLDAMLAAEREQARRISSNHNQS